MREIVERGDLTDVEGQPFIRAPVSDEALDALAAFEAEGEDRENDLCDETPEDAEPDFEREPEGYSN